MMVVIGKASWPSSGCCGVKGSQKDGKNKRAHMGRNPMAEWQVTANVIPHWRNRRDNRV